jgi:hypothetical protein
MISSPLMGEILPLILGPARADAPVKIARHHQEMAEHYLLLEQNPGGDSVEAYVMVRPLREGRERMRINAKPPPPTHDRRPGTDRC